MRGGVPIAACAAACALAPAGVAAQLLPDPAARLSTRDISATAQARDTMNRYAECVVRMRVTPVRRALSEATYEAANAKLAELARSECLADGELQMPQRLFRGAIYRALYMRDFGRDATVPEQDMPVETSQDPLFIFSNCVATLDPAGTRAFVLAQPATAAETNAVAKLGESFERCLAPGDQVRFSKSMLQGGLAEALYKRTVASAASSESAEVN